MQQTRNYSNYGMLMISRRLLLRLTLASTLGTTLLPISSHADIRTDYRDNVDVQVAIAQAISDTYGRGLTPPGSIVDTVILLIKADPARAAHIVIAAIKANPGQMFPILRAALRIVPEQGEYIVRAILDTFPKANTLQFIVAIICEFEVQKLPVPEILLEKLPPKTPKTKEEPATSSTSDQTQSNTPSDVIPPPPAPAPMPGG